MSIAVVIPTSSIPSCPSTEIIDQTIQSVKDHLPGARIIVTCDGLKPMHEHRREQYEIYKEYITGVDKVKCFPEHVHQSGMLLNILPEIDEELLGFIEHDWILGAPIEWGNIIAAIKFQSFNYVKFHAGNRIHPLHEHLMRDRVELYGSHFIQTVQFSANPFLCSTEWMRRLTPFFEGKTDFIENLLHGPIACSPWEQYKLGIYNPVHGDMKRVTHTDGRQGEAQ